MIQIALTILVSVLLACVITLVITAFSCACVYAVKRTVHKIKEVDRA